jgi:hypothetical protein
VIASRRFLFAAALLAFAGLLSVILGRWNGPLPAGLYFLFALACLAGAAFFGGRTARRSLLGACAIAAVIAAILWWSRPETCLDATLRDPKVVCTLVARTD